MSASAQTLGALTTIIGLGFGKDEETMGPSVALAPELCPRLRLEGGRTAELTQEQQGLEEVLELISSSGRENKADTKGHGATFHISLQMTHKLAGTPVTHT